MKQLAGSAYLSLFSPKGACRCSQTPNIFKVLSFFLRPDAPRENKCQPILVQGLWQDIEINFHINNIYGSVAQWISAWL